MALPLHGRHKGAVTQDKVTGSILTIIRQRDAMKVERDILKMENERLKSLSSSSWILVNNSEHEVRLYHNDAMLIKAPPLTAKEQIVETKKPLKVGDQLKFKLSDSKTVKLTMTPGATQSYKMADGDTFSVTIDFLTGSRVWILLVR